MLIRLILFCTAMVAIQQACFSQKTRHISIYASYGPQLNFFANSFDEESGPQPHRYFYNKQMLGSIAGVGLQYDWNSRSFLQLEYNQSKNKARVNYAINLNGVDFYVKDFNLHYINHFFQLGYGRRFAGKKSAWIAELGLLYLTTADQSIVYEGAVLGGPVVEIAERNFSNSGMEEAGFYGGVGWERSIDTRFTAGIKARAYYLVSISFLEAVSLTPVLRCRIGK
ncbi:MAG: hypothetical protein ACK4E0_07110 [Chitinophagaceae bacterium]